MKIFVDSSAVAALIIKNDENHESAVISLKQMTERNVEMVLSNFILAETYNLIAARTYPGKAREWILTNTWTVERVTPADENEALKIIEKYADKDFSYTDATSFSMIKRLGLNLAFTFDRHFRQYGILTQKEFQ
ncbi:MAG: type II toxin-antitoxin system VapC family toxin [Dethiobacteria bacterium]|jgi:predicted nucleic acid-binding protein